MRAIGNEPFSVWGMPAQENLHSLSAMHGQWRTCSFELYELVVVKQAGHMGRMAVLKTVAHDSDVYVQADDIWK